MNLGYLSPCSMFYFSKEQFVEWIEAIAEKTAPLPSCTYVSPWWYKSYFTSATHYTRS